MGKAYRKRKTVPSDSSSFPLSFVEHPPPSASSSQFSGSHQLPPPPKSRGHPPSAPSHPCNHQCYPPPPPYPYPFVEFDSSHDNSLISPPRLPPRERILIGRHAAQFDVKTPPSRRCHNKHNSTTIPKTFINPMVSSRRGCTDVICCFLFILFVIGWAFVATLGECISA